MRGFLLPPFDGNLHVREALLILYLAGSTAPPLNVHLPTMEACQERAEKARQAGHKTMCIRRSGVLECADCGRTAERPTG